MRRRNFICNIGLISCFLSPAVQANVRAPKMHPKSPSSAIAFPSFDPGLTIQSEKLTFICNSGSCLVKAAYFIHAMRDVQVDFDFMVPSKSKVFAILGKKSQEVMAVPAQATWMRNSQDKIRHEHHFYLLVDKDPPIYRASVTLALHAGRNRLEFKYRQELSLVEARHGYFTKSEFAKRIEYLLGPIKEWRKADDFKIDFEMMIYRKPPSWFERTFGHPITIGCFLGRPAKLKQVDNRLVFQTTFKRSFPDIMECRIGQDDLVPP